MVPVGARHINAGTWDYKLIKLDFDQIEIIRDENNELQTEPALNGQENVRIADTISEIQPELQDEHKGIIPETAGRFVFE